MRLATPPRGADWNHDASHHRRRIGVLSVALSLHRMGLRDILVLEGVRGVNLLPHAVREPPALGLADELAALGAETTDLS